MNAVNTSYTPSVETIGFQLVYVGVSFGIGLISGILTGLFSSCEKDKFGLLANSRFFRRDYSLYRYISTETRS